MIKFKSALKFFIIGFSIVALIIGGYSFLSSRQFRVREVEIQLENMGENNAGYTFTFPKIKEELDLRLRSIMGINIWRVDLKKLLNLIESDSRVSSAKISRVFPDKISISILPHTPLANIMLHEKSNLIPVARSGEILSSVKREDATDSPILRGEIFLKDRTILSQALSILISLPESGTFSQKSISEIFYDKKNGFQLLTVPNGTRVWLGFDDFARRSNHARRVADYLQNENMSGRIIDARFRKKVVVRSRNEP
ncbi:MAG: FtsQ-type POTRA domain-containing protein [Bdellovibrionales bacterium]